MTYGTMPIVRLEVERLKSSVLHLFSEQALSLDSDIRAAVEAYCTPENIANVIATSVNDILDRAVRDEVDRFYREGSGRQRVAEAVRAALGDPA